MNTLGSINGVFELGVLSIQSQYLDEFDAIGGSLPTAQEKMTEKSPYEIAKDVKEFDTDTILSAIQGAISLPQAFVGFIES